MVVNKVKKTRKYLGHVSHGGGSRKKRRGAGSRGGRGNAGTGKRAGHKVAGISRKLGNKGFTRRGRDNSLVKTINVTHLTQKFVEKLVASGKATKNGEIYDIDLGNSGYTKLLGTGNTTLKLKINIPQCSATALKKIEAAGGEVKFSNDAEKVIEKEEKSEQKPDDSEKEA
jgi:large subunit ribosomal protein L15